jgi:hypothetical protein
MKKLWLLLLTASLAQAAYNPGTFIADPTTPTNQAKVQSATPVNTDKALTVILQPNSASIPVTPGSTPASSDTKLLTQSISSSTNTNMNVNGAGTVGIQITGTWSGNINFQASTDGTNFFQIYCNKPNGTIVGNASANGNWFCPAAGYQTIQLNSTAWVSGTAVASMVASVGSNFVYPMNEVQGNLLVQAQEGGTWNITNVSGTVSLPTGASTSALQTTANTNLTTINTTLGSPFQAGGALGAGSALIGKVGIDQTTPGTTNLVQVGGSLPAGTATLGGVTSVGTAQANAPVYNDYTSTAVTTSAYVQMVASTSNATNHVQVFDSSGQAIYLATGGAGSEVNQIIIPPGGGEFPLTIAASTRVSYKAVTGSASSGYTVINFYK